MVYTRGGQTVSALYGVSGSALGVAYDVDGNPVFSDGKIRLMEYNVGGWYIGSGTNVPAAKDSVFYNLQNGILAAQNADILCICEYWNVFSQTGRTALSVLSPYFPYVHAENGNQTYTGRAICSKKPIESYTRHVFSSASDDRYYDEAIIKIGERRVHFFVTHLHPSDQSVRVTEATEICNYVKTLNEKYIIAGDFNNILRDPMSSSNEGIYRQFLNEGCTMANDGAFGIFPTACNSANWANDKFAIDNIIASSGISINNVWTDDSKTTNAAVLAAGKIDHIPLIAELTIEDA